MNQTVTELQRYLTRMQKACCALCGWHEDVALPLYVQERYALFQGEFMGKWRIWAIENEGWKPGTPGEYRQHFRLLSEGIPHPVVLVLPRIHSIVRDRLVDMGVPFVTPFSQLFLPEALIHLTEKYPGRLESSEGSFTPLAQAALLVHLLKRSLEPLTGKEIAVLLGCTDMMVSKIRAEFHAAGLCQLDRKGRGIHLRFEKKGPELWEQALPRLRSPVKTAYWVDLEDSKLPTFRSGLTALSELTLISGDVWETHAIHHPELHAALESGKLVGLEDRDAATHRLESWSYAPALLAEQGRADPLSLWLSLRDDPDERVQGELESLMENVKWR